MEWNINNKQSTLVMKSKYLLSTYTKWGFQQERELLTDNLGFQYRGTLSQEITINKTVF